ncbi:hypothetical protein B9Z55_012893 [Caenorhabditis nigoni]|nr:hypothetical protein B9Z55_012893 [Caenorhabditis nigoni]
MFPKMKTRITWSRGHKASILENPSRSAIRLLVSTGYTSIPRRKQKEFIPKGTQGNSCLLQRASLNNYGFVQRNIVARRQFIVEKEDILVRRINISHHVYKESMIKKRTDSVHLLRFFYPTNNEITKESVHRSRPGSRTTTSSSPDNPGVRRGIYKEQRQEEHHHLINPDANEDQR